MSWLHSMLHRLMRRSTRPREVRFVPYYEADQMLPSNEGWRLAPEEDDNWRLGMVYLERDAR